MHNFFVYMLTNKSNSVLYTGFTDDVERRLFEHREKLFPNSFTARYNCFKLVYLEPFEDKEDALHREKQLKRYRRKWKEELIKKDNPEWRDLSDDWE